jgi:hypothetical protein
MLKCRIISILVQGCVLQLLLDCYLKFLGLLGFFRMFLYVFEHVDYCSKLA